MGIVVKETKKPIAKVLGTNLRVGHTILVEGSPALVVARDDFNPKVMIFGDTHLTALSFVEHYDVIECELTFKLVEGY
ncbi:hypothetical protein tf_07 [Pseudomonas phage tf]|uniref:Uncharacterized protein n=1 Tax=Pseudomonas phage tf TaxID=1114179 RepID=I2FLM8_9CAUD|nr:hypothetical protein tf_07 [Pseudomonas phage tf]CCE60762.1 hypothetical protein tf_07 [Pseudomonas phage tf]